MKRRCARASAALLLAALACAGCAPSRIGWGVVLWSADDGALKTGSVVAVRSESALAQTFTVDAPSGRLVTPDWRVELFSSEKAAQRFAAAYAPFVGMFGRARFAGVVICQKPDATSTWVYRLRDSQIVKLIALVPGDAEVNGVAGHWYDVLTGDGSRGFCFDADLKLSGGGAAATPSLSPLDELMSAVYRPAYFADMAASGRYDLAKFSDSYGLFPDPSAKRITIVKPDGTLSFSYTAVTASIGNEFSFVGSSLVLAVTGQGRLRARYTDPSGKSYDEEYVSMSSEEVNELIGKERARRQELYDALLQRGRLESDYFGSIELKADMTFRWRGYSRLVPDVVPADAEGSGSVELGLYLDDSLKTEFDGAVTFRFAAPGGAVPVSFLYSFADGGVKLTYLPPGASGDNVVTSVPATPLNIFFRAESQGTAWRSRS